MAFVSQEHTGRLPFRKNGTFRKTITLRAVSDTHLDVYKRQVLWQLTTTREKQYVEEVNALLDELELRHIYFQQLALDWRYRLSRAVIFEQYTEDMLPRKYLYALPDTLRRMQGQIVELFENVLDADNSDEPTSKRMVDYYQRSGETAFRFYPQPIGFELIGEVFTEVLTPNNRCV